VSQHQLKLVFSSSNGNSKSVKLSSVKCRMQRATCSPSPFALKVERLQRENPGAAALIERLVDDVLVGPATWHAWLPPLE
jgi:hypothetical protein